jgi:hypothetical protein
MTEYQACYRVEHDDVLLPIIFVSKKDAINYVRQIGLIGCYLYRESQSGVGDYKIAI